VLKLLLVIGARGPMRHPKIISPLVLGVSAARPKAAKPTDSRIRCIMRRKKILADAAELLEKSEAIVAKTESDTN